MKRRQYRGVTIERNAAGYYTASVLVSGGPWGDYFRPLMADTVHGMRAAIADVMNGAR